METVVEKIDVQISPREDHESSIDAVQTFDSSETTIVQPLSDQNEQEIRIDVISSTDVDYPQANFEGVMQGLPKIYSLKLTFSSRFSLCLL